MNVFFIIIYIYTMNYIDFLLFFQFVVTLLINLNDLNLRGVCDFFHTFLSAF